MSHHVHCKVSVMDRKEKKNGASVKLCVERVSDNANPWVSEKRETKMEQLATNSSRLNCVVTTSVRV